MLMKTVLLLPVMVTTLDIFRWFLYVSVCFCVFPCVSDVRGHLALLQGRIDVLSRHLDMAPAGLKGAQMASRHGKSRAAIVAAATAAGMAAGGVLVADGPKDAELKDAMMLTVEEPGIQTSCRSVY